MGNLKPNTKTHPTHSRVVKKTNSSTQSKVVRNKKKNPRKERRKL